MTQNSNSTEAITVYTVFSNGMCRGFHLKEAEAMLQCVELQHEGEADVNVIPNQVNADVIQGEVQGSFVGPETCHAVFQYRCGKWTSEDVDSPNAGRLIAICGCKLCGNRYSVVYYPATKPSPE